MTEEHDGRAFRKGIVLAATILLLSTGSLAAQGQPMQQQLPPPNTIAYVPILLVNAQQAVVAGGTQVLITVDWAQYKAYLASNLTNVEFFSGSWVPLYAWLENNASNVARDSRVWVKLDANGIGPNSSSTIYLGFLDLSVNNLSPTGYWGEAPTLSPRYGEYDNGAMVFDSYSDFSGFSLPAGWTSNDMDYTVVNGLVAQTVGNGVTGSMRYFKSFNPEKEVLDVSAYFTGLQGGGTEQFIGWDSGGANQVFLGLSDAGNGTQYSLATFRTGTGPNFKSIPNGSLSNFQTWSVGAVGSSYAYLDLNYYDQVSISPYYVSTASYPYIFSSTTNHFIFIQWIRTRESPPNDVMPTATFWNVEKPYYVTFTESGLPPGTQWSVTLDGISRSSTGNSVQFPVSNGTYDFTIQNVSGFNVSPLSSSIEVIGSNVSVKVMFSKLYSVSITESGLPLGESWNLTLNGENSTSSNPSMNFQLTNGTYSYSVQSVNGFNCTSPNGTLLVNGKAVALRLKFVLMVQFTFIEIGLPSHSHWSVWIDGNYHNTSSPFISITLPNGTYSFVTILPSGYTSNAVGGKVSWNNTVVLINASSPLHEEIAISVVAILIALSVFLYFRGKRKTKSGSKPQEAKEGK